MSASKGPQGGLQNIQVNVPVLIGIVVVLVAGGVYAFVVKPSMDEAQIKKNWATEQAASQRGPNRQASPAYESAVRAAIEKERAALGATSAGVTHRRRDE